MLQLRVHETWTNTCLDVWGSASHDELDWKENILLNLLSVIWLSSVLLEMQKYMQIIGFKI